MPTWQRPLDKGRLFIHFDVAFPEPGDLGDHEIAALADLLPPRPSLEVDIESCQEVSVSDIDMEQELRRQKERQMEEEDEDDPRGGRVQCAQQVRPACRSSDACDAACLMRSAARSKRAAVAGTRRLGWSGGPACNTRCRKPLSVSSLSLRRNLAGAAAVGGPPKSGGAAGRPGHSRAGRGASALLSADSAGGTTQLRARLPTSALSLCALSQP